MRFKYIGLKVDGERAFKETTGIEWMPGSAHEVTDRAVAEEMLKHPTIWEPVQVKLGAAAKTKAPSPAPTPAPTPAPAGAATADPLAGLDDAGVRAWAKTNQVKVQSIGVLKGAKLREKVLAAAAALKAAEQ